MKEKLCYILLLVCIWGLAITAMVSRCQYTREIERLKSEKCIELKAVTDGD